ncbi:MAG TPA: hypothetical protein VFE19_10015 [Jatrophihabitantaceae bacterium]|jgi:hypothetical protein|nr:hypothetical protein [Jatrophihabitantaceae bacterium]
MRPQLERAGDQEPRHGRFDVVEADHSRGIAGSGGNGNSQRGVVPQLGHRARVEFAVLINSRTGRRDVVVHHRHIVVGVEPAQRQPLDTDQVRDQIAHSAVFGMRSRIPLVIGERLEQPTASSGRPAATAVTVRGTPRAVIVTRGIRRRAAPGSVETSESGQPRVVSWRLNLRYA